MKVITFEEAQYLRNMKVYGLVGSSQTFEITISDRSKKKNMNNTSASNSKEDKDQSESLSDVIAIIIRNFNISFRKLGRQ